MKSPVFPHCIEEKKVTLYVRVWIEIKSRRGTYIKLVVTLYVRVWIEIKDMKKLASDYRVTLYVRVWIEM